MIKFSEAEQKLLDIINLSVYDYFRSPQKLKTAILHPDLMGQVRMLNNGDSQESFVMGLMYRLGSSKEDTDTKTHIGGIVLDILGMGYISGIKYNNGVTGIQGLKFQRFALNLSGKNKESTLTYECSTPVAWHDKYKGRITDSKSGTFELMKGRREDCKVVHQMLEQYYNLFIERLSQSAEAQVEVQGVKNG